jgi:hypothetical protein
MKTKEDFEKWTDELGITESIMKSYLLIGFKKGYELAQKEMDDRLKEAEECLKFYADRSQWDWDNDSYAFNRIAAVDLYRFMDAGSEIGGKRAREYFKKWGVE